MFIGLIEVVVGSKSLKKETEKDKRQRGFSRQWSEMGCSRSKHCHKLVVVVVGMLLMAE
jgi:hypothetical protein